jgi:hypothetical protein
MIVPINKEVEGELLSMTFFDRSVVSGLPLTEDKSRVTALLHYTSSSTVVNTILEHNSEHRWLLETHPSDSRALVDP